MEIKDKINDLKDLLLTKTTLPDEKVDGIDIRATLHDLASKDIWNGDDLLLVDLISKKFDISGSLSTSYDSKGEKSTGEKLSDPLFLELLIIILCKSLFIELDKDESSGLILKRFNVLFKSLDLIDVNWMSPESFFRSELDKLWNSYLIKLPDTSYKPVVVKLDLTLPRGTSEAALKEIPLTVMFYEGPIARAYLETIKSMGLRPKKIIELIAAKDIITKKTLGRWMPIGLRRLYASSLQTSKIHYWPNIIKKNHIDLYDSIKGEVARKLSFSGSMIDNANRLIGLDSYCQNIEQVLINDLSDPLLNDFLSAEDESAVLFTGGGIVPTKLLEISGLKFIHIHPGHLPDIRGADCSLWSILLSGHSSGSSFYMNSGVDTGDIIKSYWLPKLCLELNREVDIPTKYRAIYSFLDPWIRAFVLRNLLSENSDFLNIDATEQVEGEGINYHFMHSKVKEVALDIFTLDR